MKNSTNTNQLFFDHLPSGGKPGPILRHLVFGGGSPLASHGSMTSSPTFTVVFSGARVK